MSKNILPVLLGADLNCYNVARAFHELYGVKSYAFGKYRVGETRYSSIIEFCEVKGLERKEVLCRVLYDFALAHKESELFLIACTDEYQMAIIENKAILGKYYFCPCPDLCIAKKLRTKEDFYKACEDNALPYPKTLIMHKNDTIPDCKSLDFPLIIKPSDSVEYWHHPFENMKKVYTAANQAEAERIVTRIYQAGYCGSMILQELIPADEDDMYVLTTYSDTSTKVRMACMGHVLLGEHTPKGLGNHVAIVTEQHGEIINMITNFLEKMGYTGFANFDIIRNKISGEFKILEINLRQGRSNYYITASGINIAKLIVNDRFSAFENEKYIAPMESFWHTVPKSIIYKYITDKKILRKVKELCAIGREFTSLFYKKDIFKNPLRAAYVTVHNMRYFKKYKIYR